MRHPLRSFRMVSSICSGFLFVSVCVHAEGFKYTGAGACSATTCHGSAKPKNAGLTQSNEFTIWSQKDKHAKAFEALYSDDAQAIAKAMGLGEAAKAEKCLTCHTTGDGSRTGMGGVAYKDKALQGTKYDAEEGVSCNACHGPAGKWLDPHTKQGWTTEQRKANPDKAKLFKALGLYDTKPVMARANNCVSCHLRIDVKMIEAEHPPLYFELSTNSENMPPHWKDKGAYLRPKLWAAGQTAALRESLRQLAERAGVSRSSVHAYIVGEHGDTEFPLWSKATIGTVPILDWETPRGDRMTVDELDQIADDVRNAAYKVIQGKGATNYAIGLSSARIVEAILNDEHAVMPVSPVLHDFHGVDGVALSVPSVVSASGARPIRETTFAPNELELFHRSAEALRDVASSLR